MTDLTDNVESEFVNWLAGGTDVRTVHTDLYVALHSSDPGEAPDGTTELDNTSLSYERVQTAAGTDWGITNNTATNSVEVSFPQATESWGDVTHFSLWDGADETANALATDVIRDSNGDATTKSVGIDDTLSFASGDITITID